MTSTDIYDWNGQPLVVARSRGGVLVTEDPLRNMVRGEVSPWPSTAILQKLYKSRQQSAFSGDDLTKATRVLGYYCDLQSVHSEDVLTWSVFGTLDRSLAGYLVDLLDVIQVPSARTVAPASVSLWRRVPHPDTLVPGGPEIDFCFQMGSTVVLGEAKWRSREGAGQGKAKDKSQLQLRKEFLAKYGHRFFREAKDFVVLSVSPLGGMQDNDTTTLEAEVRLHGRDTTWETLCGIKSHPCAAELQRYLNWKLYHSKPLRGAP